MTDQVKARARADAGLVTISINGTDYEVPEGPATVARLKQLGGVPPADDLNLVERAGLKVLADDGSVRVHEGTKFISTPKSGGASGR